jgi:hypothetical protein
LITTTKWFSGFFVVALALSGSTSSVRAETSAFTPPPASTSSATSPPPASVPQSPSAPASPPVRTAEGGAENVPAAESEAPPEMKFGRGARPQAPAVEPTASEAASTVRTPTRLRTMEEIAGASIQEMTIRSARWRYSLNFFGDISLSGGRPAGDEHTFGFGFGAQDVLIRGELSNSMVATTEMAFEPGEDGGIGVDIERFNVRWQSSRFFIDAGRTHTGFGYWNNAYHHGRWLQPTIARPRWVAFEDDGGILPVHWVGAGTGARLPLGDTTLNIMFTVGNGRGKIVDDVRNNRDYQTMKAFHGSLELVGIGRPELRAGVAGIFGRIPAQPDSVRPSLPNQEITEVIGSAHVAYVNVPLLLIAEGYDVAHLALGHQWTTYGGFFLIGYAFGRVTPYVELERIASKGGTDPFFNPGAMGSPVLSFDTVEGIFGLRLDLSDWTALKAEFRDTHAYDFKTTQYEGILNWSWGF